MMDEVRSADGASSALDTAPTTATLGPSLPTANAASGPADGGGEDTSAAHNLQETLEQTAEAVASSAAGEVSSNGGVDTSTLLYWERQEVEAQAHLQARIESTKERLTDPTATPASYKTNSEKEKRCLTYLQQFTTRFAHLYPSRAPLLLSPANEFGIPVRTLRLLSFPFDFSSFLCFALLWVFSLSLSKASLAQDGRHVEMHRDDDPTDADPAARDLALPPGSRVRGPVLRVHASRTPNRTGQPSFYAFSPARQNAIARTKKGAPLI